LSGPSKAHGLFLFDTVNGIEFKQGFDLKVVRLAGIEPTTLGFGGQFSPLFFSVFLI